MKQMSRMAVPIISSDSNNNTATNTVNKGKLTCHGFCEKYPATKTNQEWELHPDPRIARN